MKRSEPAMSKKFTQGSESYQYECLMQELPSLNRNSKEEQRAMGRYLSILRRFMIEHEFSSAYKIVADKVKESYFDRIPFKNENHRDMFHSAYARCKKYGGRSVSHTRTAVIYILSTNDVFASTLWNYISNPLFRLENMIKGIATEETYNLYQAAKKLCGLRSGLRNDDLTEEGIIESGTLCMIMSAMYLKEYGLNAENAPGQHSKTDDIKHPELQRKLFGHQEQKENMKRRKC